MQLQQGGIASIIQRQSDPDAFRNLDYDTAQKRAFMGSRSVGALASNYSHCQLYNPVSATKVGLVDAIIVSTDADGAILLSTYNDALSTTNLTGANLYLGQTPSTVLMGTEQNTSTIGTQFAFFLLTANTPFIIPLARPFLLAPSKGVLLRPGAVNQSIKVAFFWREL